MVLVIYGNLYATRLFEGEDERSYNRLFSPLR